MRNRKKINMKALEEIGKKKSIINILLKRIDLGTHGGSWNQFHTDTEG